MLVFCRRSSETREMIRRGVTAGLRTIGSLGRNDMLIPATSSLQIARFCHHEEKPLGLPRPQDKAPNFSGNAVVNKQFKQIGLGDYKGKWLVLFFYPLDFTFVCPTEIVAFSDRSGDFQKINCEVVACSTDSHFSHLAWINTPRKEGGLGDMKIPVLSDFTKKIAQDYGVLLPKLGAALRGLFIIDPQGILKHVSCNDLPVGRSVDEAFRLVEAFQFVDKHGEVCPANWKKDGPTIKPDPNSSKDYFRTVNK